MTIFDARDVAPEQTRALFDVALRQILFLAECAKTVANNHAGIIPLRHPEGKRPSTPANGRSAVWRPSIPTSPSKRRRKERSALFAERLIIPRRDDRQDRINTVLRFRRACIRGLCRRGDRPPSIPTVAPCSFSNLYLRGRAARLKGRFRNNCAL